MAENFEPDMSNRAPAQLSDESSEATHLAELPNTPEGWVERLGSLDFYKEHRVAIGVLGAAALAAGIALSLPGTRKIFVGFADRRAHDLHVISVGETAEYGAAIALPVGEEGLRLLDVAAGSNTLFAMTGEPGEVVRPSRGGEHASEYTRVAQRAAGWLTEHFSSQINHGE